MENRIKGTKSLIDYAATSAFFVQRAGKHLPGTPYVTTSYQDKNPDLSVARDIHEKGLILPLLKVQPASRVIDIGCGVGRWADSIVPRAGFYLGLDFCPELVQVARERLKACETTCDYSFQSCSFQNLGQIDAAGSFTHGLVSGVMAYINDTDLLGALHAMGELMAEQSLIYIREPVGLYERLTLNKFFSTDLEAEYSAIYRTANEYRNLFQQSFFSYGYSVIAEGAMLTEQLANRQETGQYYFILER